jgi:hypothetical protein
LDPKPIEKKQRFGSKFIWKGKDVTVVTGNDPNGNKEKNYASYIGIKGDYDTVVKVADQIKKMGASKDGDGTPSMYIDENTQILREGWWSLTVMGGDTPLDAKADLMYDVMGYNYNDVDDYSDLDIKAKMEEKMDDLIKHAMTTKRQYVGIALGHLISVYGPKLKGGQRNKVIKAFMKSEKEWAKYEGFAVWDESQGEISYEDDADAILMNNIYNLRMALMKYSNKPFDYPEREG